MAPTTRPARDRRNRPIPSNAIRILLTGFGPFSVYKSNPSWEAVSALHDTVILVEPTDSNASVDAPKLRSLHITAVNVPVVYSTVLGAVPLLHKVPPEITLSVPEGTVDCPPPASGYDFVFHVGVGLPGALAVEQLAHKTGYNRADADGKLAPVIQAGDGNGDSFAEQDVLSAGHKNERGFGDSYEQFSDELQTSIDAAGLVEHLGRQGYQHVRLSNDAGRYVCDFIYYCSLAESRRSQPSVSCSPAKVLFMHVPPVGQPYTVEEMSCAVEDVVRWVASTI